VGSFDKTERLTLSETFYKRETGGHRGSPSRVMESSFEDTKPYVLTALGRQFVHYVMEDLAPQIGGEASGQTA
jgi:hypothetical protein